MLAQPTIILSSGLSFLLVARKWTSHMSERQAIFQFEEHSFVKHAHFRDKQKFRYGMNA